MSQQPASPAPKNLTIEKIVGLHSPEAFHLAPDGRQLAYLADVGGQRQVHIATPEGGWPRQLTIVRQDCEAPQLSPDGAEVAFVRESALWVARCDGSSERRLLKTKAGIRMPRWSPDGRLIACYSRLRGWDQIWLIDLGDPSTRPRLLTPKPGDYEYLAWSPAGHLIAYTMQRADLRGRDLYVVEVASGQERLLSDPQRPALLDTPVWMPSGEELLYVGDLDGWAHLWAVSLASGAQRQLTSGPCEDGQAVGGEAFAPVPAPDGRQIAFVRNRAACFDLMLVAAEGGEPRRISQGDGVWSVVGWMPDGQSLLATFEAPYAPPDLWRVATDGEARQLTFSLAGGIDAAQLPRPEQVCFASEDGLRVCGTLYRPQAADGATRLPAIVYPHGGPTWQHLRYWSPFLALLAQEGYMILAPDFRGSTGYGSAFRDANFGVWGVKDTADVVAAARYLQARDDVDGERVGVFGGSYGGYMVLCALTRYPEVFRCGVDLFGDSEIALSYRHGDRAGRQDLQRMMGQPEENQEAYRAGSPVYLAEHVQAPLLILHGKDDMRVVPLMSEKMIEALKIEGKYHEAQFYEGEGHGFDKPENRKDVYKRILRFLNAHLKDEDPDDE
jgi:dipeptidyl aminopeptidase/acylaminoacyl peptidase